MNEGSPIIQETIRLGVEVPMPVKGLQELLGQLEQVKRAAQAADAALIKATGGKPALGGAALVSEIKELQKGVSGKPLGLNLKELSKAFDVPLRQLKAFTAATQELKKEFANLGSGTLRSAEAAGRVLDSFYSDQASKRQAQLRNLQTPPVTAVHGGGDAKLEGTVKLAILAAQVQASVDGPIKLVIPASQIVMEAAGTRDPKTGQFVGGSGGSGGSGGGSGGGGGGGGKRKGPLTVGPQPGEYARTRVENHDTGAIRETVSRRDAMGKLVHETWTNLAEKITRTVSDSTTGENPLKEFARLRKKLVHEYQQAVEFLPRDDRIAHDLGLSHVVGKHADALEGLLSGSPYLQASLGKVQASALQEELTGRAATLRARAGSLASGVQSELDQVVERVVQKHDQRTARQQTKALRSAGGHAGSMVAQADLRATVFEKEHPDVYRLGGSRAQYFDIKAQGSERAANAVALALGANPKASPEVRAQLMDAMHEHELRAQVFRATGGGGGSKPKPGGEFGRFLSGLQAFSPMGMLANVTKVTGWAAAVTMLYKSVELARYSLERFIEVGEQTARLDVVFRKVGGSAEELTSDVIKLSAANATDTHKGMASATEWARLGLSRSGVAEATRVSLAAANVAHMQPEETTKQLSTLMHVFELDASDLNGVLGMLTATSQRYNVTLEDLFTGLDRSAATAKQARVSLAELQALLAVMVGRTGQTGIIVGNTLKNIFTQFNNPTIQRYLRQQYGVETMVTEGANAGQVKSGSQILRDVFVRYSGLKHSEQADMARQLAGRLQVGRFQSLMEGYVDSQKLAVDTQLRLNAAQEANARILGTLKAQMTALRVEWDRVAMMGGMAFGGDLSNIVRAGKNSLRAAEAGVSWLHEGATRLNWLGPGFSRSANQQAGQILWDQAKETFYSGFVGPLANRNLQQWLARKFETPWERGEEPFQNRVQELHGQGQSAAMKARLFETVKAALPGAMAANPEIASRMQMVAASEMSPADAAAFQAMASAGNKAGMAAMLTDQSKRAHDQSLASVSAELAYRDKRTRVAKAAQGALTAKMQPLEALEAQDKLTDKQKDSLAQLRSEYDRYSQSIDQNTEARTRAMSVLEEELGKTEQALWIKQQYIDLLKQQEMVQQGIDQLSSQGNPDTMGTHLDSRVGALQDEVAMLTESRDRLEQHAKDVGTPEARRAVDEMQNRLTEKTAELNAQNSPQMRMIAAEYDARTIAERRAHSEASSWAVGYTDSGRLMAEEGRLQMELGRAVARSRQPGFGDLDAARAKQLEVDPMHVQEQIQTRIVDLARQERQIRLDSMREFNKGLLLAGPGEMLQRLGVAQMMQRGHVSPGEFFSLSPEMRRLYFEARGGDAGMMNRMEQTDLARAGRHHWTVGQDVVAHAASRGRVEYWNSILRRNASNALGSLPGMPLPQDPVGSTARTVAGNLGAMNSGVVEVTRALAGLRVALDGIASGGRQPTRTATSAGRMDITAGQTLNGPTPSQIHALTPVPGTQATSSMDFRTGGGWAPNAAQQAALREAGIQ